MSNELSMHEWLGVLGAGLIAAAMIALALPSATDMKAPNAAAGHGPRWTRY